MDTGVSVRYLLNDCIWKHFFDSNSDQAPLNLIFFDNCGNPRAFRNIFA